MMGFCKRTQAVIPAKAGIQSSFKAIQVGAVLASQLDADFCRHDDWR